MKKNKEVEKEEALFLSLCGNADKQILTGKAPRTVRDFERLFYAIESMKFNDYAVYLTNLFPELFLKLSDQIRRETIISEGYPNYYEDEEIISQYEQWLISFCRQMSTARRQKKYAKHLDLADPD